jgi:hypothetical protein
VLLHLKTFKDGHIGNWDDQNFGSLEVEDERKIVSVEGFQYGNAVSLTWVFMTVEESDESDDEEGEYVDWGFNGHYTFTDGIATGVTGYFYYFEYDEEKDTYDVSERYEGKFTL